MKKFVCFKKGIFSYKKCKVSFFVQYIIAVRPFYIPRYMETVHFSLDVHLLIFIFYILFSIIVIILIIVIIIIIANVVVTISIIFIVIIIIISSSRSSSSLFRVFFQIQV